MKEERVIKKRDDGFVIKYAGWDDFSKLKNLVNNLSEESKKFYDPWMFKNNPSIKIKIGQFLARMSLIPFFGKILKIFYPFGYAIILKCVSKDDDLVGIISIYNFKRLSKNTFAATHADMIIDKYQNIGLGSFQRAAMDKIAPQENVSKIWMRIHKINERSLSWFLKNGYEIIKVKKNFGEYKGQKYDMVEILKGFKS